MSQISLNQLDPDVDFWGFVACTKCYMPYSPDSTSAIPFWLTECGHVVCNNHLNPDHSCACCGAANIQVAALQRQMDPPMSEWFNSVPVALDTIAFASKVASIISGSMSLSKSPSYRKFQQEMLAGQIRYYRQRYQQYRSLLERLKREFVDLRKTNEALSSENDRLKHSLGSQSRHQSIDCQDPADFVNPHKKRPMVPSSHQYNRDHDQYHSSSPRSITTPVGPNRITLPTGHQAPSLSAENQRQSSHHVQDSLAQSRPPSSRQLQQYVFAPPNTAQYKPQPTSKVQVAPRYFQRINQNEESNSGSNIAASSSTGAWLSRQGTLQRHQPPLSVASKFRPAIPSNPIRTNVVASGSRPPVQRQLMGPPPTPQLRTGVRNPSGTATGFHQPQSSANIGDTANRRFVPSTGGRLQQTPQGQTARSSMQGSGQRMPFVPGNSN